MEDVRDGDLRVPLISSLFFVLVIIGGIFLTFYVFAPNLSKPWFPLVAFLLIGSPWAFWMLTYLYTCFKGSFRRGVFSYPHDPQIYRRGGHVHSMNPHRNSMQNHDHPPMVRSAKDKSMKVPPPPGLADVGSRHVHFGEVVVVESDGSQATHEMEAWKNASKLVEMPPDACRTSS